MVQTSEWGPPLWRILHTLAERLGRQANHLVAADEARTWAQILRLTEAIMPCPMCRNHYRAWRQTRPIEPFGTGQALREGSRRWLWSLHEQVNTEKGVTGPPFEALEEMYGGGTPAEAGANISQDLTTLSSVLQRASQVGQIDGFRVREWKAAVSILRRLAGV